MPQPLPPARWWPRPEIVPQGFRLPPTVQCDVFGTRLKAAVTVVDKCGQITKGVWWMSWHREAKKDVVACDKLRGTGKRVLIRRCLNRETGLGLLPVTGG